MKAIMIVNVPKEMIGNKYKYTLSLESKTSSCNGIKGNVVLKPLPTKLEKQTTRKPIQLDRHWKGCPSCKEKLISHDKPNYCQWCGQKLDWGETEKSLSNSKKMNEPTKDKLETLMGSNMVRRWKE